MISVSDILGLVAYQGSITFLLGTALLIFLYFKYLPSVSTAKRIVLIVIQLITAFILSVIFLFCWNFGFGLMFLCFFLPGLAAEIITVPLFYFPLRCKEVKKKSVETNKE